MDSTLLGGGNTLEYKGNSIIDGDITVGFVAQEHSLFFSEGLSLLNNLYDNRRDWDKINSLITTLRLFIHWI